MNGFDHRAAAKAVGSVLAAAAFFGALAFGIWSVGRWGWRALAAWALVWLVAWAWEANYQEFKKQHERERERKAKGDTE